jgi:hypothetical protein
MRATGTDTSPNAAAQVQHLHARSNARATQDVIAENVYAQVRQMSGEFARAAWVVRSGWCNRLPRQRGDWGGSLLRFGTPAA